MRVPTLTGAVTMTIPPLTEAGRTFRLRGKGLPGKAGPGDLSSRPRSGCRTTVDEAL